MNVRWRNVRLIACAPLCLFVHFSTPAQTAESESPAAANRRVNFVTDVQPILAEHCYRCHGPDRQEAGLRWDRKSAAFKGGESGPAIVPGKSVESRMIHLVLGLEKGRVMPKRGERLSAEQIGILCAWIDQGAEWPETHSDPAPASKADFWTFKPSTPVTLLTVKNQKWVRNAVDRFVLAKLEQEQLAPAPEADRGTLIRRLSYDLTGLSPTAEAVDQFIADTDPQAYEKLVDRLLASPRYGERWARHWLDVVHYGETHGYDKDKPRRHAWPYRDYVIRSFNEDKPYWRFIQEQLAGDALFPGDPTGVVALGFLAAGPWDYVGHVELPESKTDGLIARYNDRDDMIMTTMSTFQSLTVHCARCHDHKFDPISQREYYSLQAVFAGVDRAERPFDSDRAIHAKRQRLLTELSNTEQRFAALSNTVSKLTEAKQGEAFRLLDESQRAEWILLTNQLADLQSELKELPTPQWVYAAASSFKPEGTFTPPTRPRTVHFLKRGDVKQPGDVMAPGALSCVAELKADLAVSHPEQESERRAALARWITHPSNHLTRRSIVNRVWHYHFGRGIVETPNDFGHMGSLPTHPELLDWLAHEFQQQGESLKNLHRLLLTSATYRQSSAVPRAQLQQDQDNRWFGRMNRKRLDAESIRDAMLFAAGVLDLEMGGPSVEQFAFKDDHSPVYDYSRYDLESAGSKRRSIYRFIVRSVTDPFMDTLDCPDPSVLTDRRTVTTTALQALTMLNDPFVLKQSERLAQRVRRSTPELGDQISEACRQVWNRAPDARELTRLRGYAQTHGLESLCRVLFNSSEFVFLD